MKLFPTQISLSRIIRKNLLVFCILILQLALQSAIPSFEVLPFYDEGISRFSYKRFIDSLISTEKIDHYLRYFTKEPHVASSARNNALAEFILKEWKSFGLDDVHLAHYDVLLSFPEKISVALVSPIRYTLNIREEPYEQDPDTSNPNVGIPYNAYSQSGDVTSFVVYANGGNPGDYSFLEEKGIDLKGKIALVRYSMPYSYRGFKALEAEKRGLAALLIYSDPQDDGYSRGNVFPEGPWGPMSHIQRGGIPYDFIYPGDPLTPGWASVPGCQRISREKAEVLPKIISVPISAREALPLFRAMGGEKAPREWQGGLPVPYRIGGSKAKVRIQVKMHDPINRITNVIGCIKGTDENEGIVLAGNHRDAWIFGGHDPSSGTACMMELVRAFAEARKKGFKPRRTIYFASWDAEEFTLTGSTEWGEENRDWLKKNLIAYLNVDSSASGQNFSVQAVPSLSSIIHEALREVKDPVTKAPVYKVWKAGAQEKGGIVISSGSGKIEPIGSGTDHTVFLNHIGVPSLSMAFSGDYGVYHSQYDNYFWMTRFGDPGMKYTATLAKIWAHMIIDLACDAIIPLDYKAYAEELENYVQKWAGQYDPEREKTKNLLRLIDEMQAHSLRLSSLLFDSTCKAKDIPEADRKRINRLLIEIERDFTVPQGIPGRPWFKHIVFGTRYTYAVLLLPALTEAAEEENEREVQKAIGDLEGALKRVNFKLKKILAHWIE